ncbi:hypothetical protein GXW74_19600 [Roseomonas eburnea]|uniref:Response regulatory domain-containing protein n=1 Tax=Neoroseomonas eburnea TaxID=1346889 RepID=A0A9X9XG70_9PROT|nr:response regulator [Neoroseomonas eburnea]MBR0682706.1 hypothetical protein [Neoroseomonas eburnea]
MAGEQEAAALCVLLVDPMPATRVTVIAMLEEQGHEVLPVSDWTTAEDLLLREEVGAVVMAFVADGFDGKDAAARLRDRLPPHAELPLVGTTSGLRRGEEEEALEAGFDVLLAHPFEAEALAEALRQAARDRTPPPALDPERRAALRREHGPAALAELDDAAMETPGRLLAGLFDEGGGADDYVAAGTDVAAALEAVGCIAATAAARRLAENPDQGRRLLHSLMTAVVAARVALRKDRMTAAAEDPIWAASDTPPGDTP